MNNVLRKDFIYLIALLALSVFLFSYRLDSSGLIDMDESRYAQSALEMIESGDYIVPHLNSQVRLNKPILFYWFEIASLKILGINEFAARFPSVLFGVLGIIATFLFGRRVFEKKVGFTAGLILITSPIYIILSRLTAIDMSLCFFVTGAMFAFWLGYTNPEKKKLFYCLAYIAAGSAFLLKGPVGIIVISLVIIIYLLIARDIKEIGKFFTVYALLIFLVINLPWYIAAYMRYGLNESFHLLYSETLGRFLGKEITEHREPFYFYIPVLAGGLGLWSIFLPSTIIDLARNERNKETLFLSVWAGVILIFFSICTLKTINYILPVFPALALLSGIFWNKCMELRDDTAHKRAVSLYTGIPVYILFTCILIALLVYPKVISQNQEYKTVITVFYIAGFITALSAFTSALTRKARPVFLTFLISTVIIMVIAQHMIMPIIEIRRSTKPLGLTLRGLIKPEDELVSFKTKSYSLAFYSGHLFFYTPDMKECAKIIDNKEKCYVILDKDYLDDMKEESKKPLTVIDRFGDKLLISN